MKRLKDSKTLKFMGIFIIVSFLLNSLLSIIAKVFRINFYVPTEIVNGPIIFYKLNIHGLTLNIHQTIVNTWVLMLLLFLFFYFGTKKLSVKNPGKMQIILEEIYNFVDNMFLSNYGKYKRTFMPFFTALFLMIALSNLSFFLFPFAPIISKGSEGIEVVPFFRTATADINTTVGLALVVMVIFIGAILKRKGIKGYIKELCYPFVVMFPINLMGELAKPINISIRLFGNMVAGLVILTMIYTLNLPHLMSTITDGYLTGPFSVAFIWPVFIQLYLDLFVGVLQAFVFTVLSSVYIEQSLIGNEN